MTRIVLVAVAAYTAAAIQDYYTLTVHDIFPTIIAAAGLIGYGHLARTTNNPMFIGMTIAMTAAFAGIAYLLQRHGTWKPGDTLLFTAAGTALWPIAIPWLLFLLPTATAWVTWRDHGNGCSFAPVYAATTIITFLVV